MFVHLGNSLSCIANAEKMNSVRAATCSALSLMTCNGMSWYTTITMIKNTIASFIKYTSDFHIAWEAFCVLSARVFSLSHARTRAHTRTHTHTLNKTNVPTLPVVAIQRTLVCRDPCPDGDIRSPSNGTPQKLYIDWTLFQDQNKRMASAEQSSTVSSPASYVWGRGFVSHTRNPADLTNRTSTYFLTSKLSQQGLISSDLPVAIHQVIHKFVERCENVLFSAPLASHLGYRGLPRFIQFSLNSLAVSAQPIWN
jgi:hypothetical protein